MFLFCAITLFFIIWASMNWLIGIIPLDSWIIKMVISLTANIILGLYAGKIIGRKLLYKHLKKIYKNKELTDD